MPTEIQTHALLSLPVPVMVVDGDLRIVYVNLAVQEFLLTSNTKLAHHGLPQVFGAQHKLVHIVETSFTHKNFMREVQMEFVTALNNHAIADVLVSSFEINFAHFCAIVLQPQAITKPIEHNTQAQASAHNLSSIAGILAHEIKNPLAGIRGAAQLLGGSASEADKPLTELITIETDRISRLITHMEQFGVDAARTKAPFNIHEVLNHVQKIAQASFAQNIEFIEQYDPSLPDILGSKDQMIQVILNLIKNAAEAMSENVATPKITLTTAYKPGLWVQHSNQPDQLPLRIHLPLEVCVIDNGSGIAPQILAHMFEPFHTSKPDGRGLGLALVAKIINDHGGVIDVKSEKGNTQFRILLPMLGR